MVWPFTESTETKLLKELLRGQARIEQRLGIIQRAEERDLLMASKNQELLNQIVEEQTGVTNAVAAIEGTLDSLIARIEEAKDDPAELTAILEVAKANKSRLVAAALKGTPSDPVPSDPVPPPPPEPEPQPEQPSQAKRRR